jgi:transposase
VPPGVFPPEVSAQATALACSLPQEKGKPLGRWSLSEIAAHLVLLKLVSSIAISTIGRWLAQEKLKPWRYHHWQHILDPETFLERAGPVLALYQSAKQLLGQGIWVLCLDEKPSIQARKRPEKPRPAGPGQPQHISPRYERKGALQLFAALSVADGKVFGQVRNRKRFVDFQAFLSQVILPEALHRNVHAIKLIMDNSTTHAPKQLEDWLQQQIKAHGWPFSIEVLWLPKNASWLNPIEIWFSSLQRKLLQPNHFHSLRDLASAIDRFIRFKNRSAKPIRWTYTIEKLEAKLGTI